MQTSPVPTTDEIPLEHLEHEICQLSAHSAAAMCRWLELVAEFDRREGWGAWGARSCAHWLNWKCGLSMVAAHEHVRVARRLLELPLVRRAFSAGQLSYSKARALTRMATPRSEQELVELARHATAAHLDRLARARRAVDRADEREEANRRSEGRHLHHFWDDDGSLVLTARLDPEEGALVLQALDAAHHALRNQAKAHDSSAEESTGATDQSCAEEPAGEAGQSSAEDSAAGDDAGGNSRPRPTPGWRRSSPSRGQSLSEAFSASEARYRELVEETSTGSCPQPLDVPPGEPHPIECFRHSGRVASLGVLSSAGASGRRSVGCSPDGPRIRRRCLDDGAG